MLRIRPGMSIPDPGSNNSNKRGEGKKFNFVDTNFTKLKIILFLNRYGKEKKICQFTKNSSTVPVPFSQKIVINLSKIWAWEPGSGKNFSNKSQIPGSKRHLPDPGSGSVTLRYLFAGKWVLHLVLKKWFVSGFTWVNGSGSGLRIRIPILAGRNCPPEKGKNEEISYLKSSLLGWRLLLEPEWPL